MFTSLSVFLLAIAVQQFSNCQATETFNTIAFYYDDHVPVKKLSRFDIVVVDQESDLDPKTTAAGKTKFFAYTSVGEEEPDRSYFEDIPKSWIMGDNPDWHSKVINLTVTDYPEFFVSNAITPQWERGYRGFFLDSLDSYELIAKTSTEQARQQAGLVKVIKAIKSQYHEAKLIINGGFEILPQVNGLVYAVAFESLFQGWNQENKSYVTLPPKEREEYIAEVKDVKKYYKIPLIAIDYCAPADKVCSANTVAKIRAEGIIPYVGDGALTTIGISE